MSQSRSANSKGIAYLVGAGPGDPGLLTLRGRDLIARADVVIYDYLCNPEHLDHARPDAEILYAGKSGGNHTLTQDQINALIVEKTRAGLTVVRLKGGDPFVFGRGGEEAQELVAAGLAFEVVPGITSAIAAPAYAGIPITHRDFASGFTVLTGHEDPTKENSAIDWAALARFQGTKVVLMGVERLRAVTGSLLAHGADPATPAALVRWGTWAKQETLTATLATLADEAEARGFKAPAVTLIGGVVSLRAELDWVGARPLFGQRIVVTRTRTQAGALSARLRELGADVLEIPTIRLEPLPVPAEDEAAWSDFANRFDWLLLTSPNAADLFFDRFLERHGDIRALGAVKIAVVGPGTAAKVGARALGIALQPKVFTAEGLAAAFADGEVKGKRFCFARADLAGEVLPDSLRARGGEVSEWTLYRTVPETGDRDRKGTRKRFAEEGASWITFASASAAESWHRLGLAHPSTPGPRIASIGPVTSEALRRLGYTVDIEAKEQTLSGLVDALISAAR
ncbi:uroporphyrinogen III methyltransferase / synthase [Verrucomicrobium sp. GAS474]|uniref:uroporphyrinogen-III C-methyltransferase n=1 Tax=Verrucomicrobium sp. GAS474 TaxID=1882831 RepID=UPI00087C0426|nr:uroporphyrinogen-III C-methyltransferase [Verrucomicrobium sp. GAS474]SDT96401.1 uroporphyrinogen III methyltransferase / synthase [Verrucomicrobium sp. GAS474]